MSTPSAVFGARVRRERQRRGWPLRELSAKSGVTINSLSLVERDLGGIGLNSAARIADALGLPLGDLLKPPSCATCYDAPPPGFTCNACGAEREAS